MGKLQNLPAAAMASCLSCASGDFSTQLKVIDLYTGCTVNYTPPVFDQSSKQWFHYCWACSFRPEYIWKLELCAFALKGEHNVYSLVPNIPVCIYIDQKWIYIKLYSTSSRFEHCSNHSLNFQKSLTISDQYHNFYFCEFLYKMAAGAHFGCLKFTFDRISGHFRSICNFCFEIFDKMTAVGHLGCPRLTFDHISGHFRSIRNFIFVWNLLHFGCPKIIFDHISGHFRSIRNFFLVNFFTKWPPAHFCPFQTFFWFFYKMAGGAHFGCPKFTFDRISGHFRSIRNFFCCWHFWHNGCRWPFWMSEIHFRFLFFLFFLQNGCRRPFWMSEIHFRSHFWPFQIDMQLYKFTHVDRTDPYMHRTVNVRDFVIPSSKHRSKPVDPMFASDHNIVFTPKTRVFSPTWSHLGL